MYVMFTNSNETKTSAVMTVKVPPSMMTCTVHIKYLLLTLGEVFSSMVVTPKKFRRGFILIGESL